METSGTIALQGDVIRYDWTDGSWELSIDRVRVIGEATTANGPWLDDYYLCFATGPDEWFQASFYAVGGPFSNVQTYSHDVEQYLRDATRCQSK